LMITLSLKIMRHNPSQFSIQFFVITFCFSFASFFTNAQENSKLKLWYKQAAENWNEALPVGNGRLGAMVFGYLEKERIQLNEESVWAGQKMDDNNPEALKHLKEIQQLILNDQNAKAIDLANKYMIGTPPRLRSQQTLGDVYLDFGEDVPATDYKRSLDLETGIASTTYQGNGVNYKRETFVSAPDNSIIIHLIADKPGMINCKVILAREMDATIKPVATNVLEMSGQLIDVTDVPNGKGGFGMKFTSLLKAINKGGKITSANNSLFVENANEITIIVSATTDYNLSKLNFDRTINTKQTCEQIINNIKLTDYASLLKRHLAEYQPFFNRVSLQLGTDDKSNIPTDERLKKVKAGEADESLVALYFQYGRYLLMNSSRKPAVLPANLQGIWNKDFNAPWDADFHTNINLQMNYWLAEVCNLSETTVPLANFIDNLRVPGRVTAKEMYGINKGWVMHHCTDVFGRTGIHDGASWGTNPIATLWLCLPLWEDYRFTLDKDFLRKRAYPIMKEAAEFVQAFLIEDKNGNLVTAPSTSPENAFKLPDGSVAGFTYAPAMDIEIIHELYNALIESSKILNEDASFAASLQQTLKRLPPVKISQRYGTIQEWVNDYEETEPGHRHMSHLFGLYPGTTITPKTPELFDAANKTLERRLSNGGGHTGWSRAWVINFFARLQNGEKAYENVQALLAKSTSINLFDMHPPFQIDGNFGGTAGIAEMLIQSQNDYIQLLPALPKAWESGAVKGLCARGGFVIDMEWKNGMITRASVFSKKGGEFVVKYADKEMKISTKAGGHYTVL